MCVLAGALFPAPGAAQTSGRAATILKAGLQTFSAGSTPLAIVSEVGSTASTSRVTIEFRDASDQRVAFTSETLTRGRAVQLLAPAEAQPQQLRVIVGIVQLTSGENSEVVVGLEDVHADSVQVVPKVVCAIEPIRPAGAQGHCGGWHVNNVTVRPDPQE
jgi:hypothetical protein